MFEKKHIPLEWKCCMAEGVTVLENSKRMCASTLEFLSFKVCFVLQSADRFFFEIKLYKRQCKTDQRLDCTYYKFYSFGQFPSRVNKEENEGDFSLKNVPCVIGGPKEHGDYDPWIHFPLTNQFAAEGLHLHSLKLTART